MRCFNIHFILIISALSSVYAGIKPVGWTSNGEFVVICKNYDPENSSVSYILEVIDVFNNKTVDKETLCDETEVSCDGTDMNYLLGISNQIMHKYKIEIDTAMELHHFPYTIEKFDYTYKGCDLIIEKEKKEKNACGKEFILKYDVVIQSQSFPYSIYNDDNLNTVTDIKLKGFYKSPDSYLFAIIIILISEDDNCKEYTNEKVIGFAALPEED
jgi:hypothetical protein